MSPPRVDKPGRGSEVTLRDMPQGDQHSFGCVDVETRYGSKAVKRRRKHVPGALDIRNYRPNVVSECSEGARWQRCCQLCQQRLQAEHEEKRAKRAALSHPRVDSNAIKGHPLNDQFVGVMGIESLVAKEDSRREPNVR